jgi:uncharacterized protein
MPRPRRLRRVYFNPNITHFKPAGMSLVNFQEIILSREELESIRLIDYEGISQEKSAKKMKVSQPTLSRILSSARKKISKALINGLSIKIQGGNFKMVQPRGRDLGQGGGMGFGVGPRGRMGNFAAGPGGICKCPKCGYETEQIRGQPCNSRKCPKCRTLMTRG